MIEHWNDANGAIFYGKDQSSPAPTEKPKKSRCRPYSRGRYFALGSPTRELAWEFARGCRLLEHWRLRVNRVWDREDDSVSINDPAVAGRAGRRGWRRVGINLGVLRNALVDKGRRTAVLTFGDSGPPLRELH